MTKVVFLDRDGVVNVERGEYTWKVEDFKLTVGLVGFIRAVQERGYKVIIISNQGGIGRGLFTMDDVEKAHQYLKDELAKENLWLTDIYYCPHHPASGKCFCRKPEPLLLEKAIARYQVDVTQSYFIGDSERDIAAGNKVGVTSILIKSNDNLCDYLSLIND
ncbi:MAG: HAD family hydrolase [Bacteroidota bacterium]|nr:HAD family hydrolase [Bacteroidota bacterium]